MATPSYKNGIWECSYCGERYGTKAVYCPTCRTQAGRKKIFDANVAIALENKGKGYEVPAGFKNWK
jgi:hypothetical protein